MGETRESDGSEMNLVRRVNAPQTVAFVVANDMCQVPEALSVVGRGRGGRPNGGIMTEMARHLLRLCRWRHGPMNISIRGLRRNCH